ncbi:MAG: flagellar filament capping protein FliD [Eubacterium sp.]|nr:flagellar filament capping protein FliD [Eubacterium sp.]
MPMRLSGMISGMDTEAVVGQLMSAQSLKKKKVSGAKTKLEWKQDAWKELNKKLTSLYNNSVSKLRLPSSYNLKKATLSDSSKATITADAGAVIGNYSMEVKDIASAQFLTSAKTSVTSTSQKLSELGTTDENGINDMIGKTVTFTGKSGTKTLTIDENTTVDDFLKTARSAGINANYDTTQKKFFFSSKETGSDNAFSITDGIGDADGGVLKKLGLDDVQATTDAKGAVSYSIGGGDKLEDSNYTDPNTGMALVGAKDSRIILNGAELTSSSSVVSANGLNISLVSKTKPDEPVSFSVSNDVDAVYDNIKKALSEYNEVMKEMHTLYNAASSKGYEPLTSEEKRELSEDEVEEWEKKIKDSLFRRDSTLQGIMSGMRDSLMSTTTVNGKMYSLSSFGIMTSKNYQEGGLLHIFGDEDDEEYSGEADKLKKALMENPDDTISALTDIFENLRSTMFNKMKSTEYSSSLTFYNDKQIDKDLANYKTELKEWDDKLAAMEDAYFKKFAAMESAMAKLQAQQSSLGSLLGMG